MKHLLTISVATLLSWSVPADIVHLANGDRFIGNVQLVNEKEIHLKSEVAGVIKVPREKVTSIHFGTNQPAATLDLSFKPQPSSTAKNELDPKAIEQVQREFLATAGPEANAMFKELVEGLGSGKLNVNDIREQARQSLQELKDLQSDLGDDEEFAILSTYANILERFINQGSTNKSKPSTAKPAPQIKTPDEE